MAAVEKIEEKRKPEDFFASPQQDTGTMKKVSFVCQDKSGFCVLLKNTTINAIIEIKEGVNMRHEDWLVPFLAMDLCSGALVPIVNDDEDMLEIRWADGMRIDVGFIKDEETYYITTVADDTLEGWNNPLSIIAITTREELPIALQKEIYRCRS